MNDGQISKLLNKWAPNAICSSRRNDVTLTSEAPPRGSAPSSAGSTRRKGGSTAARSGASAGGGGVVTGGSQLTIEDMGGVFIFFALGTILCLMFVAAQRYTLRQPCLKLDNEHFDKGGKHVRLITLNKKMQQMEGRIERIEHKLASMDRIEQQLVAISSHLGIPSPPPQQPEFPTMYDAAPIGMPTGGPLDEGLSHDAMQREQIASEVTRAFQRYDFDGNGVLEGQELPTFFTNVQFACHNNPLLTNLVNKAVKVGCDYQAESFNISDSSSLDLEYCIGWWQDKLCSQQMVPNKITSESLSLLEQEGFTFEPTL